MEDWQRSIYWMILLMFVLLIVIWLLTTAGVLFLDVAATSQ